MAFQWLRRAFVLAASSLLLAACGGGGDVVSQLQPSRIVAFGDGFSDLGQVGGARYTVNGGGNLWSQQLAARYGLPLTAAAAGGTSYATGNARVAAEPDAAGNAATPTIAEQIDTFLASGGTFGAGDLVLINGGISDVIVQGRDAIAGVQSGDQAVAGVRQAGRDMGAQVRRLVDAGARYVVVVGPYNLGRSAWVRGGPREGLLQQLSSAFDEELKIAIVDLGSRVLYVDLAFYYNLVTASPTAYTLNEAAVNTVVCNTVDPGPGIGIGPGRVNSALCNTGTVVADPNVFFFADPVYPTPRAHVLFGDYAYDRVRNRF
ncbi:SGNH/GDSL hydrolase family protein [Ramlibacter tataouinensis]|uniref:Esterase-like protein n=1 Tax=Ramlibacter tataouinensis (strain ATCC BAA-407 / DSM 14655 / LMG 21543 / TTB310) TaxID=365046 RepID=F5Y220_RAMTT|nr:SGNH/GDSL hydrolase family protein [Ramlibacter tataouinensis]AEG94788.1 esterase-like protein [Ramlibacter tataouinensis TTB310]